jgi:hypothetical protein
MSCKLMTFTNNSGRIKYPRLETPHRTILPPHSPNFFTKGTRNTTPAARMREQ